MSSMCFLNPLKSHDNNWNCVNFYLDGGNPSWKCVLILSLFIGNPRCRGKVRGLGGTESFTPKSAPLGPKS